MPGVFEHVPLSGVIDPPLWTLRYRVDVLRPAGAVCALAGVLATRMRASSGCDARRHVRPLCLRHLRHALARGVRARSGAAARFVLCFFLGGALYLYADKIRLDASIAVALGLVAVLCLGTAAYEVAFRVALAYGVLWFALVPAGPLRRYNMIGDYSLSLLRLLPDPADLRDARPGHRPSCAVRVQLPCRARARHIARGISSSIPAQAEAARRSRRRPPAARRPAAADRVVGPWRRTEALSRAS